MQPASSTTQQPNYGTTTTSTTSMSSTNADRPPTVRTAETNQRTVTVRRDKDSSEESTEKEKSGDKKSQASGKPTRRRTKKGRQSTRHRANCYALLKKSRALQQPSYRRVHRVLLLRRQPAMYPGPSLTRLKRIGCNWKSGSKLLLIVQWQTVHS